jgi:hypothetical protein
MYVQEREGIETTNRSKTGKKTICVDWLVDMDAARVGVVKISRAR